jgi:elongation factor 1-beta
MGFGDLTSDAGLASLNSYLEERSYIVGYTPSAADSVVFEAVSKSPDKAKYPHATRWYKHIASYGDEVSKLPGEKKSVDSYGPSAAPAKADAAKPAADDDDDVDLFGSDEEEDAEAARIREERLAAYAAKKEKKPALIAKSSVLLDVKPWDDETDMAAMEKHVRGIEMDGLVWGASKLLPVGYGIKKLQIMCVIEDDKVSVDALTEQIQENEDLVQSVDIAAFNKI